MSETAKKFWPTPAAAGAVLGAVLAGWVVNASNEQRIAELTAMVEELQKPPVPFEVTLRKHLLSAGSAVNFRNTSTSDVAVVATLRSASGTTQQVKLIVPARETREVGSKHGWAVQASDSIILTGEGLRETVVTFPAT